MADQHTAEVAQPHRKSRQASSASSISFASESSLGDKPEWFTKDTSVQYQKTLAEVDPAVGFFCKAKTKLSFSTLFVVLVDYRLFPSSKMNHCNGIYLRSVVEDRSNSNSNH